MADILQRFLLEKNNIRGEIVYLKESFATIMSQHHYPRPIQDLLSQTLLVAVLLSATIKYQGLLTIQFQSEGAVKLLVAKCDNTFHIRGLAQYDKDLMVHELLEQKYLIKGQLVITVQSNLNAKPYQSIIDVNHRSIVESVEDYFLQSEQLPTKLYLITKNNYAFGLLLQLLPSQEDEREKFFWQQINLIEKNNQFSQLDINHENIIATLQHVFYDQKIRVYDPQLINFRCNCNLEKMQQAVLLLGKESVQDILKNNKQIEVTCEFCNHNYLFNKNEVDEIFQKLN